MTHVTMICPTVRPAMFMRFMDSLDNLPQAGEYWLAVHFQGYTDAELEAVRTHRWASRIVHAVKTPFRIAPYVCRAAMYRAVPAEVYISLDDDMEILPTVDWASAVAKAQEPGAGVISCNCVRFTTPALIERARYEPVFMPQILVMMSGGMVYGSKVAAEVLKAPVRDFLSCDIQVSLLSYLAGWQNYRYLGSLIAHNTSSDGGLRVMLKASDMVPLDPRYINMRPGKKAGALNNYVMPVESDLTPLAHEVHKRNREKINAN